MTARASQYPIRVVSRMTGLSLDTLRAWERRYKAVVPDRGERGRVYTDRHVSRLQLLAALVARGHAIGQIAGLPDSTLSRLHAETKSTPGTPTGLDLAPLRDALDRFDLPAIESLLNRHAIMLPPDALVFSVVLPILKDIGDRWQDGEIRPAHEHLVSAVIRSVLGGLLRTLPNSPRAGMMVMATAAGERHELGLLCAAVLAAAAGVNVVYLGPDLPASDIAYAASIASADTLVLAATHATIDQRELLALSRVPPSAEIWVGGAHAGALRSAIGSRARQVDSLEDFQALCASHVP